MKDITFNKTKYNTPPKELSNKENIDSNVEYLSPDEKNTQNKKQINLHVDYFITSKKNILNKENLNPNQEYCCNDNKSTQKPNNTCNNQEADVEPFTIKDIPFSKDNLNKDNFTDFLLAFYNYKRDINYVKLFNNANSG